MNTLSTSAAPSASVFPFHSSTFFASGKHLWGSALLGASNTRQKRLRCRSDDSSAEFLDLCDNNLDLNELIALRRRGGKAKIGA